MKELEGKVIVVTGAGAGIGETVSETLLRNGACVVAAGRDAANVSLLANRLDPAGQRVLPVTTDVRDSASVAAMIHRAVERFGALHGAVNNAGIPGARAPLAESSEADWHDVIATDLTGVFLCLKHELPAVVDSGGGAIVNMSSANGIVGVPGAAAYTAAKHGILGLTRVAALDYAAQGVRVNAIGPGYVATPRLLQMPSDTLDALAHSHPLGRLATREDVAELVSFLLSDRARFCTGGFHVVDGGYTAA